jgi:phosphoglycerate dehydrogenase-like enzyme
MEPIRLLVIGNPSAPHLRSLDRLPPPVEVHVGKDPDFIRQHAPDADAILCAVTSNEMVRLAFLEAKRLRWMHVLWAGVEKILFPELIESPVPLTNGKGVFKDSLAQFALGSILFFAKDFRCLLRQQQAGVWESFDVQDTRGQVLGIVGYGGIGKATAELARAFGIKVVAFKRTPSAPDQLVDRFFTPNELSEMLALCDYILVAAPLTTETRGMIGAREFGAMKKSAVIINVGRGPVIDEPALIAALERQQIQGAALDVFDQEPLPTGHPFYRLSNVLLSPHSADHTVNWIYLAVDRFVETFQRFRDGLPLDNLVDKKAGY